MPFGRVRGGALSCGVTAPRITRTAARDEAGLLSVRTVRHNLQRGCLRGLPAQTVSRRCFVAWFVLRRDGAGGRGSGSRWVCPAARRSCRSPNRPRRSTARLAEDEAAVVERAGAVAKARSGSSSGSCSTVLGGGLERDHRAFARGLCLRRAVRPRACGDGRRHGAPGPDAFAARWRASVTVSGLAKRRADAGRARSGRSTTPASRRVSATAGGDWSHMTE